MVLNEKKWKKLEDDIMKAGVMKYGINKWPKISTLLQDKTPKQCKERWKAISPGNTLFSEEEVIQLLDMARALPNQWTAISKYFVNKSPRQCYEMYQGILFDDAKQSFGAEIDNSMKCLNGKSMFEAVEKRVFNKDTGRFEAIVHKEESCIVKEDRMLTQEEIDYTKFEEDEKDLIDLARTRLKNTKSRKDLKRRVVKEREEQHKREKKARNCKG